MSILLALGCSLLWAGVTIASKVLAGTIPTFAFGFLRYGLAALALLPVLFVRRPAERPKVRDLPIILFLGFSLVFAFNFLLFVALSLTSATSVALISATNPILMMLISAVIYRHIPNKYQLLGFVLSFAGVVLVITQGKMGDASLTGSTGEFLMLAGVFCQISYTVALKKLSSRYSPLFLSLATCLSGLLFVLPFVANTEFVRVIFNLSSLQWALLAFVGLLGTALAIIMFSAAVTQLGPARLNLTIFSSMPIFTTTLAYFILGEQISLWQLAGGALVVTSLIVSLRHTQ